MTPKPEENKVREFSVGTKTPLPKAFYFVRLSLFCHVAYMGSA